MDELRDRFIKAETHLEITKEKIDKLEKEELPKYTRLSRFSPVEKIVYGATSLILIGVMSALINLVLKK